MKFTIILVISIITTVTIGIVAKKIIFQENSQPISPTVKAKYISYSGSITDSKDWKIFVNNYFGYEIKHPSEIEILNKKDGEISFLNKSSIKITISQGVLIENKTIDSFIEGEISTKQKEMGNQFQLMRGIAPIALGNVTAQTYSSRENNKDLTYYFVPQNDKKYLLITNETSEGVSDDYFLAEKIIYSLELYP